MKHITTVMLGLIIVAGAGQARAGEGAEGTLARDEIRKVVVAAEIPKSASGKILRRLLKDQSGS